MVVTYAVNTDGGELQNNYSHNHLTSGWELVGSGPSGDREYVETWEFETEAPGAVERLLDEEECVLNYYEVARDAEAKGSWY